MIEQLLNLVSWTLAWPGSPLLLAWALAVGLAILDARAWPLAAGTALLCLAPLETGPAGLRFIVVALIAFCGGWGGARLVSWRWAHRPLLRANVVTAAGLLLLLWSWWAGGVGLVGTAAGPGLAARAVAGVAWAGAWPGTGLVAACSLVLVYLLVDSRARHPGGAGAWVATSVILLGALMIASGEGRVRILEASAVFALLVGGGIAWLLSRRDRLALPLVAVLSLLLIGWTAAVRDRWGSGEYTHPDGVDVADEFARVEVLGRGILLTSSVAAAPDGRIFFGEFATGRIGVFTPQAGGWSESTFARLEIPRPTGARRSYESGLWGVAVHPEEPWVYAMAAATFDVASDEIRGTAQIVRFPDLDGVAGPMEVVLDGIPAGAIHNGGALLFGPDDTLWATVGDGGFEDPPAGGPHALPGTLLRLEADGAIPDDNPVPGSAVTAWGFRNIYGFDFDPDGTIWATENGPWCCDRILKVEELRDHGWPRYGADLSDAEAMRSDPEVVAPVFDSGTSRISPTGLVWLPEGAYGQPAGTILFATWHTAAIHRLRVDALGRVLAHDIVFDMLPTRTPEGSLYAFAGGFSGLSLGPDGLVYFASLDAVGRIVSLPPPAP